MSTVYRLKQFLLYILGLFGVFLHTGTAIDRAASCKYIHATDFSATCIDARSIEKNHFTASHCFGLRVEICCMGGMGFFPFLYLLESPLCLMPKHYVKKMKLSSGDDTTDSASILSCTATAARR